MDQAGLSRPFLSVVMKTQQPRQKLSEQFPYQWYHMRRNQGGLNRISFSGYTSISSETPNKLWQSTRHELQQSYLVVACRLSFFSLFSIEDIRVTHEVTVEEPLLPRVPLLEALQIFRSNRYGFWFPRSWRSRSSLLVDIIAPTLRTSTSQRGPSRQGERFWWVFISLGTWLMVKADI